MTFSKLVYCFLVNIPLLVGQNIVPDSEKQAVRIVAVHATGSRLPEISIQHLTGLQAGQIVDEVKVRTALAHANASGLFKNFSYTYESEPGTTDVTLNLVVEDLLPLLPASIKIAGVDEAQAWEYLQKVDPLFTVTLPNSEKAITLYSRYLTRYLVTMGREEVVVGRILGRTDPTGIEFSATKPRSVRK